MNKPDPMDELTGPSKTQLKKDMLALQELGLKLTELDQGTLEKCNLAPVLSAAISEYKRLPNKHSAKRRQLQYIGKLMRETDTSRINTVLQQGQLNVELERQRFHELELLRERLLGGDETALAQLIGKHPDLDIQHLRQLIRQAGKEAAANKAPAASRKLFKYLRGLSRQ